MKRATSDLATLALFAASFTVAAFFYPLFPDVVPVHWGADGQPDRFGTKLEALFVMPSVLLGVVLLMLAVQRFSPRDRSNAPVLGTARLAVAALALLLTLAQTLAWDIPRSALVGVGALLLFVGNVLGKTRPSAFVGVRTPWVYKSRRAWHASQRRGASWLTLFGLALLLGGLLVPTAMLTPWIAPFGVLGALTLLLGWLALASYLDYKRDPNPERALE